MRFSAVLLLFLTPGVAISSLPSFATTGQAVDERDRLCDDLAHFRALGLWRGGLGLLPLPRLEAERAAARILKDPEAAALGAGDQRRLRRIERTLGPSSSRGDSLDWHFGFALRAVGRSTALDSIPDLLRLPRRDYAFAFSQDVGIGSHLTIQSRFYEDYSRLSPYPRRGWVDNLPPDAQGILSDPSARNDRAVLGLAFRWCDLRVGRENRRMGVGRHGTLFLSDNAFPLDGVSLNLRTRYISMTSLAAQTSRRPNPSPGDTTLAGREDAYFAAHRIEFHPSWPLRIGFYEAVAWGGRGFDFAYANPVGILVAFTQDVYDRFGSDDKKVVGGDLQIDLAPVSLYGEWLLNRLVSMDQADAGEESPISSYAQLAGLRWADPLGFSGADLDLEYAHLDPEIYFHKDNDPNRAMLSGEEVLGHWLGPNADDLYLSVALPPVGSAGTFRLFLEQARWGLIDGKRGDKLGFVGLLKKDKRWITGSIQRERIAAVEWRREGWKTPIPGRFDGEALLAWVDRTGAGRAGSGPWAERSLCLELRLTWRLDLFWRQAEILGRP